MPGGARGPGLFFIIPCIDSYRKIDLRTVSFDVGHKNECYDQKNLGTSTRNSFERLRDSGCRCGRVLSDFECHDLGDQRRGCWSLNETLGSNDASKHFGYENSGGDVVRSGGDIPPNASRVKLMRS